MDYEISVGDVLKIGRVKFAVKEMCVNGHVEEERDHRWTEFKELKNIITDPKEIEAMGLPEDDQPRCRFDWSSDCSPENPLIVPCSCTGSIGYLHLNCLKQWMSSQRSQKSQENFTTYYWKKFNCEIDHEKYPLAFKHGDRFYNVAEYEKPQGNYLILESLEQEKNASRIVYAIAPNDNKNIFKLGRGHEADLRINDISVSRCHAFIKFKNGKFLLEDNMSKFGTLVLVRGSTPILPNFNKAMQIGRTVVNFSIKALAG